VVNFKLVLIMLTTECHSRELLQPIGVHSYFNQRSNSMQTSCS